MIPHPKLFRNTRKMIGRIPCYGMAKDKFSGSFDSSSVASSLGLAQDDRDKDLLDF
jgi:hypothetical protein